MFYETALNCESQASIPVIWWLAMPDAARLWTVLMESDDSWARAHYTCPLVDGPWSQVATPVQCPPWADARKLVYSDNTIPHMPDPTERHSGCSPARRLLRLHPSRTGRSSRGQMVRSTLTTYGSVLHVLG
jgi:hypothetical protein